ncbi:MAG: YjgP/YjgQ family permease [Kiritimatiellaeota bacterium]|nr:YjgP/YjgQ family permease [Kiritimatiellota bacterium]
MHRTPTGGRTSPILLRYFTREFIVPLTLCIGGFIAIFLVADTLHFMQDFLEHDPQPGKIILFFLLRQPQNLVQVLPMGTLLSACFVTGTLARNHEVAAVRAAGVSLLRAFLPFWVTAALLALVGLWLNEELVPAFNTKAKRIEQELTSAAGEPVRGELGLAFRNAAGDRDWFFEQFSATGPQKGVLVKQFSPKRRLLQWEVRAREAQWQNGEWTFLDGQWTRYDKEALPSRQTRFTQQTFEELTETPREILNSLRPAEQLSASQMLRILRYHRNLPKTTRDVYRTALWYRLAFPFSCLIGALLGVGLCASPERGGALRGFVTAVGIMVLYYVVAQLSVLFGKHGFLPPVVAALLPTLAFGAWGWREMMRNR